MAKPRRAKTAGRPLPDMDDAGLVAAALRGDPGAFEALYRRHRTPLYRTALAMTRRKGVAEEILQETFLRAYRFLDRVRLAEGASLRPWLHRILIRLVYDRSARRRDTAGPMESFVERLSSPLLSPERRAEQSELSRVVSEAIADLPFKQRIVVVLYYLQDMDLGEIADTLGVPPGTVKSRLYYARARLREALAEDRRVPAETALGPAGLELP